MEVSGFGFRVSGSSGVRVGKRLDSSGVRVGNRLGSSGVRVGNRLGWEQHVVRDDAARAPTALVVAQRQLCVARLYAAQGFAADPVYAKGEVFAYVGLPQNLKDLKPGRNQYLIWYHTVEVWGTGSDNGG